VGTTCECQDFTRGQAPDGWCQHRIAAGIQKRVQELLPQEPDGVSTTDTTPPPDGVSRTDPLPEAPASVNCHLTIAGRQVQLTLRDTDETRLLARLQTVLAQYPAPQPQPPASTQGQGKDWCAKHQTAMQENHKDGRTWWSHKTAEGWCKGK
jgi:hypothetical protein